MRKETLRSNATATAVQQIIENTTLYREAVQGSINTNIDLTNKVVTLFGATPINRCELWLDSNAIVLFVGANIKSMFDASAELLATAEATTEEQKQQIKQFVELFNSSRYLKYKISERIETKHKFKSIEEFKTFIETSNSVITSAIELSKTLKAEETTATEATAEAEDQKSEQKQKNRSKAKQTNSRSKAKQQKSAK